MAQRLPSGRFDVRLSLVLGMVLATALRADEPKPPGPGVASTPGTAFTYQGQVLHNGVPVNGTCDFQFRLYDAPTGGTQVGPQVNANNLGVSNGLFTALLDFGPNAFTGAARWLEV
ncbi:MAG: hypothetical protein NZ951_01265, partial [Dehalococcoidia bacterium]|nr:hypothetical protein [Dehalococcoidia bacterium]